MQHNKFHCSTLKSNGSIIYTLLSFTDDVFRHFYPQSIKICLLFCLVHDSTSEHCNSQSALWTVDLVGSSWGKYCGNYTGETKKKPQKVQNNFFLPTLDHSDGKRHFPPGCFEPNNCSSSLLHTLEALCLFS